ncbi:HCL397Cp [Eremothecium sinecaudum]|uniref:HCL397Cp n=1 Tax=Eremothecium sinecaudum TaxID=45286 RepID=A0A120K1U4_9SACH|nr:HCL397Cp [Eremothecium sinecaudum]AMD19754.1 HCL397Cp [Eremothecium sinecaudum]
MTKNQTAVHRLRFVPYTPGNITALAFSHNSTTKLTPSDLRLALGRSDGNIEIWNPRDSWFQELVLQGGKDRTIEGLCWCNVPGEPLRLFSIGGSTVVTEWDFTTGLPIKNYDCNSGVIWSIAINESNNKLAVGCDNGSVVLIDISGGRGSLEHDRILTRQNSRVLAVTWVKDEGVIGGCSDGRIRIWCAKVGSPDIGRLQHTMKVDKSKKESTLVWSVLYLPITNQIVSGDSTGSVKFWDHRYATLVQSFKVHQADVLCLTADLANMKVFSAGVDRKIYQFTNAPSGGTMKWTPSSNRLFHSNDIRCMASYQSKGCDFIVSGGVEKSLVISPLDSFSDGNYRKMPLVAPFRKNALINQARRLVVSWQENIVKIWQIGDDLSAEKNYKLVSKLVLKCEQNIASCALSPNGDVLVVGQPSMTKVFHLQPTETKLKVTKLDNDLLTITGCKFVQFVTNSKVILCTSDDELFTVDLESDEDETKQVIELLDVQQTMTSIKLPYINTVNHLHVNGGSLAVISRVCGAVDLVDLETGHVKPLIRLMNFITAIAFTNRNTVLLITSENKLYEFNTNSDGNLLTSWCKKNAENLPSEFIQLKDKCVSIFPDMQNKNKVWFWGASWLASLDLSIDLPVSKRKKAKKHTRDGLTINDESNFINDGAAEEEDDDLELAEEFLSKSDGSKPHGNLQLENKNSANFFFTDKYRPILFAALLSENEIAIIERPAFMVTQPPSFQQQKLRF